MQNDESVDSVARHLSSCAVGNSNPLTSDYCVKYSFYLFFLHRIHSVHHEFINHDSMAHRSLQ